MAVWTTWQPMRKAWSNDNSREAFDHPLSVAAAIAVAPRRRSRSPRADPNREWYKAQKNKGKCKDGIKGKGKEGKRGDRARGKGLKAATLDGRQICFAWWNGEPCDGKCGRCTRAANVTACTSGLIARRRCLSDGAQQEAGAMVARPSAPPLLRAYRAQSPQSR